jgi:hypothetical protein
MRRPLSFFETAKQLIREKSQTRAALIGGVILSTFILSMLILGIVMLWNAADDGEVDPGTVQLAQAATTRTPSPTPAATFTPGPASPTVTPSLPTNTPLPAVEVTPTAEPGPPPASASPEPLAIQPYWLIVVENLSQLASSLDALGNMLSRVDSADLLDENWRLTVATHFVVVRLAHQTLSAVTPPAELADFHQTLLNATGDCDSAAQYLAAGLDSSRTTNLEQGLVLMVSCGEKFGTTAEMAQVLTGATAPPASTSDPPTAAAEAATATTTPAPADTPTSLAATSTPAPSPTISDEGPTILADKGNVNIRSGPGPDFEIVSRLPEGQTRPIVGRTEDSSWWQVALPEGDLGWIAADVTAASNVDNVPVVDVPEPPEN